MWEISAVLRTICTPDEKGSERLGGTSRRGGPNIRLNVILISTVEHLTSGFEMTKHEHADLVTVLLRMIRRAWPWLAQAMLHPEP